MTVEGGRTNKKTVLVTGFGPFQRCSENPSIITARRLETTWTSDTIELVVKEVPVEYGAVERELAQLWAEHQPQLVLHLGVGCESDKLQVECRAFNKGYTLKDIRKNVPSDNCCMLTGCDLLDCGLDLPEIVADVNRESDIVVKFDLSRNPGRYLCGYIYYKSLSIDPSRCLFVHVPPFKRDDVDGCPVLDEQAYATSLRSLILRILA